MRLSILARLIAGYCIPFVLMTSVSIFAILQLRQYDAVTQSIIFEDNALFDVSNELIDIVLSETRLQKKYILVQDNEIQGGLSKAKDTFASLISQAEAFTTRNTVIEILAESKIFHHHLTNLFDEEGWHIQAGSDVDGKYYGPKRERLGNQILENLQFIRESSRDNMLDKLQALQRSGKEASLIVLFMASSFLLGGAAVSVLITRSITKPLKTLSRKTDEIAKGNFDVRLDIQSPLEVANLARSFELMCDQLKEIDAIKNEFYAIMSHELRTPLSSIKEGTSLLLESFQGEITAKQKRILSIIEQESNRLISLVNSLLELSRMEAGMMTYSFTPTEIDKLVMKSIHEISPLAEARKIEISQDLRNIPKVKVDRERILQVLRNLIGNALKFSPDGGKVEVLVEPVPEGVRVSVTDFGPGIPEDHCDLIFNKFQQAKVFHSYRYKGSGLGLAIVKQIITAHGGKVWVQSEPGRGSSFFIVLPV